MFRGHGPLEDVFKLLQQKGKVKCWNNRTNNTAFNARTPLSEIADRGDGQPRGKSPESIEATSLFGGDTATSLPERMEATSLLGRGRGALEGILGCLPHRPRSSIPVPASSSAAKRPP